MRKSMAVQMGLSASEPMASFTLLRCPVNKTSMEAPGGSEVSSDSIQASHRLVAGE